RPIVLSISGHDPTGGAGVQADSEAIIHHGCYPCSIITCLTVQDSSTVHRLIPLNATDLLEQADVLFNDLQISTIKIGLTGSIECVDAITSFLQKHPNIPVIFDPVLACGDGTPLANAELINAIRSKLLPLTTLLTPNTLEAVKLSGLTNNADINALGAKLLEQGVSSVLITGGHMSGPTIFNSFFQPHETTRVFKWPRQAGEFHGTGCTLAASIAALIAQGNTLSYAVEQAQAYTEICIKSAQQIGHGQAFPRRL
ncbi:MAG: hydroxymethylpyrimidine/phosphomethylpyrimidine kinase, partial [Cycloclasticus sp.]|nr:hydroxymethylpyrimidine/phosphomethylpyrimidine kinase [Cycloclasticus sp.]